MLIGREYESDLLDNLRSRGKLLGSFLFFGARGVGKFSCARKLVKELESGAETLTETLILEPDEKGTIGIDEIRNMKSFLSLRPVNSPVRAAIIDGAGRMTDAAANAALKIIEEPPEHALIILVSEDPDSISETLRSRLKKIYFPPVSPALIAEWLVKEKGMADAEAALLASRSFGSPEFALELLSASKSKKKPKTDFKFATDEELWLFIRKAVEGLYNDKGRDFHALREMSRRIAAIGSWNTNKKLQLQTIKWTR